MTKNPVQEQIKGENIMPIQQMMPIPKLPEGQDFSNAIYKAAHNIRAGQESQAKMKHYDAETKKLEFEASPENQNYLKQIREADLQKKQTDAKKAGLDIYTQRLAAVRDVDDFAKGIPYLSKDLEAFGEEGSRDMMPRITYKTDLSGQKQIPDNEAFLKERDRIVDALSKMTGKTKTKPGDKVSWTEDVKDEATGKMKTIDTTKVLLEDGVTWKTVTATHGGIKEEKEAKAPDVKNFQIGEREVPHQWDEAKKEWTPIKGKGGPKWNPKEDKPEMTEAQAREREFQLTKWEAQLATTDGMDEMEFALLPMMIRSQAESAGKTPAEAEEMITKAKADLLAGGERQKNFIKEQREYYRSFIKSGKKAEAVKPKAASSSKQPPAGYKDTGKTSGGKKVYSNGTNAWME